MSAPRRGYEEYAPAGTRTVSDTLSLYQYALVMPTGPDPLRSPYRVRGRLCGPPLPRRVMQIILLGGPLLPCAVPVCDRVPGVRASSPQAAKMAALPGRGRASGPRRGLPDRSLGGSCHNMHHTSREGIEEYAPAGHNRRNDGRLHSSVICPTAQTTASPGEIDPRY